MRLLPRLALAVLGVVLVGAAAVAGPVAPLPHDLADTGLGGDARPLPFSPQYPLWSDGAAKRRWIALPAGAAIDGAQPDAWDFPPGTRLWKEFRYARPIETRYLERLADGSWRYATYVWNDEGTRATLVPEDGLVVSRADAPGGRYRIPSRTDCLACHEGAGVPVLGFAALQLSADRDPLAPHAEPRTAEHVDLRALVEAGRLRNLPPDLLARPPRIAAGSSTGRAALGYLHANCGHCHNDVGPLALLDLSLAQRVADAAGAASRTVASLVGRDSRFRPRAGEPVHRVAVDGAPSVVTVRMTTRNPLARMPPLGVQVIDDEGIALVERWIRHDLQRPSETSP